MTVLAVLMYADTMTKMTCW